MDSQMISNLKNYDKNGFLSKEGEKKALDQLIYNQHQKQRYQRWQLLLPNIINMRTQGKQGQKQLIDLVRKGISDSLREQVWPLLVQKPLVKYEDCEWIGKQNKDINLDLQRTFPTHKLAKELQIKMKNVLNALVIAIPQLGYCQGMNFIVGTLLLRLNQQNAYNIAFHIFHWQKQQKLLMNLEIIHEKLYALERLLKKHYPQLHKVLKLFEIEPLIYASSWFITLFCNTLPFCYALRIIQCFLLEGEKILYRVALQILKIKKKQIKKLNSVEKIVQELKNYEQFNEGNVDLFFDQMFKISLSRQQINGYRLMYRQSKQKDKY